MTEIAALECEVHVWSASIAAHADEEAGFWPLLDADERAKAERFVFARDRTTYVISHGVLRTLLGRYLDRAPASLVFVVGEWGKPALAELQPGNARGLTFNLSHSGDYALIAVGYARAVGVDVERWSREINYDQLARICFSAAERAELSALSCERKERGFHAGWTRKEAYIKARGVGVSQGLDYFDVSLDPTAPARLIDDRLSVESTSRWRLVDLPMEAGYSAAVCAAGADWEVRRFDASPAPGCAVARVAR